jgi:hypothetical protein
MKVKQNLYLFLRGVGVGVIVTTTLFYAIVLGNINTSDNKVDDITIIERAKELGMIFITEIDKAEDNNDSNKDKDENKEIK